MACGINIDIRSCVCCEQKIQSMPLMDSTHQCYQDISSDKVMTKVVCEEKHVFRPFSTADSGATTIVKTSLVFNAKRSSITTRTGQCRQ